MTTSRLLPFGIMAVAIIAVLAALTAAGAVDNDDNEGARDLVGNPESDAARCEVDASGENCITDGDLPLGACIAEDDPNYDPDAPCGDVVTDPAGECAPDADGSTEPCLDDPGSGTIDICLAGAADCPDLPVNPDEPVSNDDVDIGGGEDGRNLAVEAAYAALAEMDGPPASEVKVSGARPVEWGNACLGVEAPDIACAQVITPGWLIILSSAEGDYEFHTDLNGNAVFAPQQ